MELNRSNLSGFGVGGGTSVNSELNTSFDFVIVSCFCAAIIKQVKVNVPNFWCKGKIMIIDCFFRSSLTWVCSVCLSLFGRQIVFEILEYLTYMLIYYKFCFL